MSNDFCMDIDRDCAHIVTMRKQLEMSDAALTEATESIVQMREQIATLTRQRDLAVEAITRAIDMVGHPDNITYLQQTLDAIKESETK